MLPKIMPLTKKVHLPIADKEVKVSAFKIAEEKLLLLHKSATEEELENILFEIIKDKTTGVEVESLTMTDLIVLLINIIDLSRGMKRDFTYKCNKKNEEGKPCGTLIELEVNALDYKLTKEVQRNRLIKVDNTLACEVEYPSYGMMKELSKYSNDEGEFILRFYSKLIKAVYHNDDVYTDFTENEIYEWTLELPHKVLKEFETFIDSLPDVYIEYDVVCPKCGTSDHYVASNLLDFFIFDTQART